MGSGVTDTGNLFLNERVTRDVHDQLCLHDRLCPLVQHVAVLGGQGGGGGWCTAKRLQHIVVTDVVSGACMHRRQHGERGHGDGRKDARKMRGGKKTQQTPSRNTNAPSRSSIRGWSIVESSLNVR
jgi:hypothetical protein